MKKPKVVQTTSGRWLVAWKTRRRAMLKRMMLIRFMRTTWPWRVWNMGRIEYTRKVTMRLPMLTWTIIIDETMTKPMKVEREPTKMQIE